MKEKPIVDLKIAYDERGLVPVVVQHAVTKEVLMLAYMNEEALNKTMETKRTWFYSRSRKQLWNKGETSGFFQEVVEIRYDCDEDTLLLLVLPSGPSCHTGQNSCFYRVLEKKIPESPLPDRMMLYRLADIIAEREKNPVEGSYTNYLLREGIDKICKKIGEEAAETIIAAKNNSKEELIYEASDLLYHLLVLLRSQSISLDDLMIELEKRHQ